MSSSTPTIIAGRYELQRRLAQGGMAEVWLAIDLTLDRKVAVKWLKPTLATDPIVAERFRREAIAAASLNHPNIVAVHDVFEQDGRQAVVMQLVDGKSLRQLLDTQNRLSPELTCHIGIAVARALDNAHEAGFVHRDVKPGNIMITPDGRVLLTDFGIAKGLHGDGSDDLTSDNIMMGTAKYLAPEQVRGKKLDGRADLYSLGLVMYECLAGRVPFLGETDADTALARLQRDPTDLARLRATLPTRLVSVVHALLSRRPDQRPADGAELIVELEAAQAEGPPAFDATTEEQSPVSPFSAGKLLRAPSDARGRAKDRGRGMRTPTPPRGKAVREQGDEPSPDKRRRPSGIPERPKNPSGSLPSGPVGVIGEPPHITGRVPVQPAPSTRVPSPRVPSTRVVDPEHATPPPVQAAHERAPRDRTPAAGLQRGAPARGMYQRWGPSIIVVGGLILLALIVSIILWATSRGGESSAPTTVFPQDPAGVAIEDLLDDADTATDAETEGADNEAGQDVLEGDEALDAATDDLDAQPLPVATRITSISAFDPDGDGEENNDVIGRATDGDVTTAWRTQCYSNQFMGAKPGVGLVVSFDGVLDRDLIVQLDNGPYNVNFYGFDGEFAPTTLDGWGEPFDRDFGPEGDTITTSAAGFDATHVLIHLLELGRNSACTDDNPYSGAISEIVIS